MRNSKHIWTNQEDGYLKRWYPSLGLSHCANHLGLKDIVVKSRCKKLGLSVSEKRKSKACSHNPDAIGTERLHTDYYEIKIFDPETNSERWIPRSRKVYLDHHKSIPKGFIVMHLNGNRKDDFIENLEAVPQSYLTFLQRKKLISEFPEITRTGIKLAELHFSLKEKGFNFKEADRKMSPRNGYNHKMFSTNTSGFTGVSYRKDRGKWRSFICIGDKTYHIGSYDTVEEAIESRLKAEMDIYSQKFKSFT